VTLTAGIAKLYFFAHSKTRLTFLPVMTPVPTSSISALPDPSHSSAKRFKNAAEYSIAGLCLLVILDRPPLANAIKSSADITLLLNSGDL